MYLDVISLAQNVYVCENREENGKSRTRKTESRKREKATRAHSRSGKTKTTICPFAPQPRFIPGDKTAKRTTRSFHRPGGEGLEQNKNNGEAPLIKTMHCHYPTHSTLPFIDCSLFFLLLRHSRLPCLPPATT